MKRRGLSLLEVLVAMVLLGMVSTALLRVYDMTVNTLRQGTGHLDLQQRVRESVRRMQPLLTTAMPPNTTQEAIYAPALLAPPAASIRWSTPEDLLTNVPVDPRAPTWRLYEMSFNVGTGDLSLTQISPATPNPTKVVGRKLAAVSFEHLSLNSIRIIARGDERIRRAGGKTTVSSYQVETLVQIPYYTSD
jgi:prepilin-type N-terminal cleavage/methylation domain-containing protein